ncbi:MAG: hypothetical protein P8179_24135 [Candidatus Thiodiazotropha sp.]|jgi:PII-like signaling protein
MTSTESNEMNINSELVEKLRSMKTSGATIFKLLEQIQFTHKEDSLIKPLSMKYFREAFGLSMSEVTPLGGWCGFGGELSNEQINELIKPYFKD